MVTGSMPGFLFLILRLAVLSTLLIVIVGCASLGPKQTSFATKIESPTLYMDIAKRPDGRYYVTGFSNNSGLVKLNDLSTTLNTSGQICGFGWFWGLIGEKDMSKTELCTPNESKFRKRGVDIGKTALGYVLSLGGFAVLGGYTTYGYFDDEAYRHAVTEALKNSNIDREAILRTYEELVKNRETLKRHMASFTQIKPPKNSKEMSVIQFSNYEDLKKLFEEEKALISRYDAIEPLYKDLIAEQNKLEELRQKYESAYLSDLREMVLSPRIIDKSQFYRNDADLHGLVAIKPNEIKPFSAMTEEGESKLAMSNIRLEGTEELKKVIIKLKEHTPRYEEYLRNATSNYKVVGHEEVSQNGYHMLIKAPKTVSRYGTRTVAYDVVILGKDFTDLYPSLSASDGNISLQFRDGSLIFKNNSKSFVNILAISVYYNNDVTTTDYSISLPPQTVSYPIGINEIVSDKILAASTYAKLTADTARKRAVDFGFAIKYQISGQVANKTLYHVKNFNLYDVVIARK